VERRLEAGRRALRRRRAAAALTALGVVAVLGTTYAVVAPGPDGARSGEVAEDPSGPEWPPPADAWEDRTPVRYIDEELQVAKGVVVHQHVENPLDLEAPERSDAFDLTYQGERQWVIMSGEPDGYGFSSMKPSDNWTGFDDWLAEQVAANSRWAEVRLLRLADDGRVVAAPGVEILERTDDPQLGDRFAAPGTPTGAALLDVAGKRSGYFVVWRVVDGELAVLTTERGQLDVAGFEKLLSHARSQDLPGGGQR
jgi:hypothetical protein